MRVIWVGVLVGVMGMVAAGAPGGAATQVAATRGAGTQGAAQAGLQEKGFVDGKSGVSLRLPVGWGVKKGIEDTGFEAPAVDRGKEGGLAANVVMGKKVDAAVGPGDVGTIVAANVKQYEKSLPGFKLLPTGPVPVVKGKGVGRIDGTWLVGGVLEVRVAQVWILGDGAAYMVTCTSLAGTWGEHEKMFEEMIGTVGIVNGE